eukprot:scaffold99138_cov30-Tisochrysis_lutea.AAC.3
MPDHLQAGVSETCSARGLERAGKRTGSEESTPLRWDMASQPVCKRPQVCVEPPVSRQRAAHLARRQRQDHEGQEQNRVARLNKVERRPEALVVQPIR